ncbi:MAG: lasso peptide biosynthesis B2 protein [Planctomycetes bacterium]|nr:lasso peptide biosynthesis B2 protein [Planctomycetota bacterium]
MISSNSAINLGRRFWRLSWRERWLALQAALLLPVVTIELKTLGIRRYRRVLKSGVSAKESERQPVDADRLSRARLAARIVRRCGSYLFRGGGCLQESITVWRLLRRQGIHSDLRIGVRRSEGRFEAHAWVEHAGVVISDTQDVSTRFVPLAQR